MRRRPIILLLLAVAALTCAAIAFADAPSTGPARPALAETPDAQNGPSLAVNPAGGTNVAAAVTGTDWRSGVGQPQTAFASGSIVAATGATTWASQTSLPHVGQDVSHGFADVAWGPGNKVYAVEVARDSSDPSNPCLQGAGIYLFVSSNGGVTWSAELEIAPNGQQANTDPSIAYDGATGRIYVAYTRTLPCSAQPGDPGASSIIRLVTLARDDAVGGAPISPLPSGLGNPQQVRPAVAVLPSGFLEIAYFDASTDPGKVMAATCTPPVGIPARPNCGSVAVIVDPSADDPATRSVAGVSHEVHVRPDVATDSSGRVVVTWAELASSTGMDVLSATSRDAGASFGAPQLVSGGGGTSDQINPSIAMTPGGRADIAFLDSRYGASGYRISVSASNRPTGLSNREAWSTSTSVDSTPIIPVAPTLPGSPSLGPQVAVAEIPRATGLLPWTLIGWTDTRNVNSSTPRNEDVDTTVLLHGATPPVAADVPSVVAPRNTTVQIPITASDAEADPLTFEITRPATAGTAVISDPNQPVLTYTAPGVTGSDVVGVRVSDGVGSTEITVNIQVINSAPVVACPPLSTTVDTPLTITANECATDANLDPVSISGSSPAHGQIAGSGAALVFTPDNGFIGTAFVTLTASDGVDSSGPRTIPVTVAPGAVQVTISGDASRTAFTDRPILLSARPSGETSVTDASKIEWTYQGEQTQDQGATVSHLFTHVGSYRVTASVANGKSGIVTVTVQKPPLVIRSADLANDGSMALRVQLASPGKLSIGLLGVHGARQKRITLKKGTHTVHMAVPRGARTRGTVIVKLSLKLANGSTAKLKRAVLLPPR